jgi:CheY-like chemotaxis protein
LIHCDSKLGNRTTFQIYFPAAAALDSDGEEPLAEVTADATNLSARILIAEDDPLIASLSATLLESAGYRVTIVADGQAAFQELLAASEPYHLVLSDIVMPKMGGVKLMTLVMASSDIVPKPLFLLSTGYNSGAIEEQISPDMCYEYVQKPFSPADLLMLVRKMLRTA